MLSDLFLTDAIEIFIGAVLFALPRFSTAKNGSPSSWLELVNLVGVNSSPFGFLFFINFTGRDHNSGYVNPSTASFS